MKYDWRKTLVKFIRGGGLASIGTLIALWKHATPQETLIIVATTTAAGEAIWNIIKFFLFPEGEPDLTRIYTPEAIERAAKKLLK